MFNFRQLVTAAALVLVAGGAMASNFRAADQVYVPVAGNIVQATGSFISDITVSNLSGDPVTVSVIYTPISNLSAERREPQYFNNRFTLQPHERRDFRDFIGGAQSGGGLGLPSGSIGSLIFNGCRQGADCTIDEDGFGFNSNFRNIAVFSRIYFAFNDPARATVGQAFPGIPWYNYVSMRATQTPTMGNLGRVVIPGFRNTGTAGVQGTFRGNLGVMNASQYSTTQLRLQLWQGANRTALAQRDVVLHPLNLVQANLTDFFPNAPTGAAAENLFVTVEQLNSTAVPGSPATCGTDGCPGFLAYGAVVDNASTDPTTLEAIYEQPMSDQALGAIYGQSGGKPTYRRIAGR